MILFFVPGTPRPQGSKRAFVHKTTKRAVVVESGGKPLTDWRGDVKRAAMEAMGDRLLLDGPIEVTLDFLLARPKSHPKTKTTWPVTRPDIDKLVRSVLDALTSVCFLDDGQVVYLRAQKSWPTDELSGRPGCVVEVKALSNPDPAVPGNERKEA